MKMMLQYQISRLKRLSLSLILMIMIVLTGCATRPSANVLQPVKAGHMGERQLTLLTATNRNRVVAGGGFDGTWSGGITFEQYRFSVPADRKPSTIQYPTQVPNLRKQFVVTDRQPLSENAFTAAATSGPNFDGTVGLFVHGYNYSYQEALFRTAQIAADADIPSAPILFSWPSEASVTGYVADRDAVLYSRTDLQAVVSALAAAKGVKRVVLVGHSMGGFLTMEAVRQLKLQRRDDVLAKLVIILAAPDIDVDVFRAQMRDVGNLKTPVTLLVSKADKALSVSGFVGGERPRVGLLDINDPIIEQAALDTNVRIIDISSVKGTDGLGHDRYASLAQFGSQFSSIETGNRSATSNVGAFVFDAAGAVVSSPFRLAGSVARGR